MEHTTGFRSVVVITSALHAEGREFEPRQNLSLLQHVKMRTFIDKHADVSNRIMQSV